jgi:hypothetical protein
MRRKEQRRNKMTTEPCPPPMEIEAKIFYIRNPRVPKTLFLWGIQMDRELRLAQMTIEERAECEELERQERQRFESSRLAQQQLLQQQWRLLQERLHILDVLDTVNRSKEQKLIEWEKKE